FRFISMPVTDNILQFNFDGHLANVNDTIGQRCTMFPDLPHEPILRHTDLPRLITGESDAYIHHFASTADDKAAVICRSETWPRGRPLQSVTKAASYDVLVNSLAATSSVVPDFNFGRPLLSEFEARSMTASTLMKRPRLTS